MSDLNITKGNAVLGATCVAMAAWVFGTAGVFVKNLEMPATVLAGFRLLVPALVLFIFIPDLRKRVLTVHDKRLFIASCITSVRIFLWVLGLIWAPMSKAVIVLFSWPLIFTVLSFVTGAEKASVRKIVLVLAGFSGIVLLHGAEALQWSSQEAKGLLCMVGAAFLFALNMFTFKGALHKTSPLEVILRDSLVGSVIFLPFVIFYLPDFSYLQILGASSYGATIGLVGYFLSFFGLARIKASTAAVLYYSEVLSACLLGLIFFNEQLTPTAWLGALLIIGASFLVKK